MTLHQLAYNQATEIDVYDRAYSIKTGVANLDELLGGMNSSDGRMFPLRD
jgi:hypothetical protein